MVTKKFDGTWLAKSQGRSLDSVAQAIGGQRDPQHQNPDPNYGENPVSWQTDNTRFGSMPLAILEPGAWAPPMVRGGPLNSEPNTHDYGVGFGAGLTMKESITENARAHSVDKGATAQRTWVSPPNVNGEYHADLIEDSPYGAGNPDQLLYQQESNPAVSPNARGGRRIARRTSRSWSDHRWTPDYRPEGAKTAYLPPTPSAPAAGPYQSDMPNNTLSWIPQVAIPQLRRQPRPWDEMFTTDSAVVAETSVESTQWGL